MVLCVRGDATATSKHHPSHDLYIRVTLFVQIFASTKFGNFSDFGLQI